MGLYYFDHAAATPMDERVFKAMLPYLTDKFYNPSSPYSPAVDVRREYEAAKQAIARTIGANGDEIIMTAGATESINIAIKSFTGHKICASTEHDSVKNAIKIGEHSIAKVDKTGRIDLADLAAKINDETEFVSVALANHEVGTVQPIKEVAKIINDVRLARLENGNRRPLVLHCDASQGCGLVDLHVARLGVDLLTLNAAKIYGPKQVGLLWVKPGVQLAAHIHGGGQEMGIRSGTENVAGVIGYAEAMRLAEKKRKSEALRLADLRNKLETKLLEAFPDAVISGNKKHRLANFLHISFDGIDAERIVFMLENKGVLVGTGSACAARKGSVSQVLMAIGMSESLANGSLRITLGRMTDEASCEYAANQIIAAINQEKTRLGRA